MKLFKLYVVEIREFLVVQIVRIFIGKKKRLFEKFDQLHVDFFNKIPIKNFLQLFRQAFVLYQQTPGIPK